MELLLAVIIVVLVAAFVAVPLRSRADENSDDEAEGELAELEARKQAKYREIRDAEADRASGKLSEEDHRRLDRELRREAVDILKRIDRLRGPQEPEERGG
jgi:type II secretory pathway pseudopilin PulG